MLSRRAALVVSVRVFPTLESAAVAKTSTPVARLRRRPAGKPTRAASCRLKGGVSRSAFGGRSLEGHCLTGLQPKLKLRLQLKLPSLHR